MSTDIAIVSGVRTPMGRYCGKLKDFTAMELGAVAAKGESHTVGWPSNAEMIAILVTSAVAYSVIAALVAGSL